MAERSAVSALHVEVEPGVTLRDWLQEVLLTFWREGDGFSGKRPLGESQWYSGIADALEAAGFEDVDATVEAAIRAITEQQP